MGKVGRLAVRRLSFSQIEEYARRDMALPEGLNLAQQNTFLALRALYASWRRGQVSRQQAEQEKYKIRLAFEQNIKIEAFRAEAYKEIQACSAAGEHYKAKLLKLMRGGRAADVELWRTALSCIGAMTNDSAFMKSAQEYIKKNHIEPNTKEAAQ